MLTIPSGLSGNGCGLRFIEQQFDGSLKRGALALAVNLVANPPLAINDERGRKTLDAAKFIADTFAVEQDRVIDFDLLLKTLNIRDCVVPGCADDREAFGFQFTMHLVEFGNLRAAGNAPRRPEVQEHDAPAQVAQTDWLARSILQLNVRRGLNLRRLYRRQDFSAGALQLDSSFRVRQPRN